MKLLLDTNAFIWWDDDPSKVPRRAAEALADRANTVLVSVVSAWEIVIKQQLGKLTLPLPVDQMVRNQQQSNGVSVLQVSLEHVLAIASLPLLHRDPFDRLLLAQAMVEDAVLVTADEAFGRYGGRVLW